MPDTIRPNSLDAFWMPFTPNRQFKSQPRLVVSAEGVAYRSADSPAVDQRRAIGSQRARARMPIDTVVAAGHG